MTCIDSSWWALLSAVDDVATYTKLPDTAQVKHDT
jgi:hypothetical protein